MKKKAENLQNPLQPSLDIAGVRQRALIWWNSMNLEDKFYKTIKHNELIVGDRTRHPDTLTVSEIEIIYDAENSLFKKPCYAKKCVYNVLSVCKCSTVGNVCQSHVA
jgi:hypothetical protein